MDGLFSKGTDFFLMQGDCAKLAPLWAFGFAVVAAQAARASNKNANLLYGTALTALGQFGGVMCVSLMLGTRSALFDNENHILFSALAWLATGRNEVNDFLGSMPGQVWLFFAETMMRCHMMIACMDAGAGAGGAASNYYPHAWVVTLACGLVGGLGSDFVPFNNGIGSMASWGDDWNSKSALLFCGWRCALHDPNVGKFAGGLFGANNNRAFHQASAIAFMCLAPIVATLAPDAPNPLGDEESGIDFGGKKKGRGK
jgi:hypothetical protein